jgi:hypothetical protein
VVDISVVTVSWNAKAYLLECLESIARTAGGLSVETIVVDNNSTDGSPDAVMKAFPDVRLVRSRENLGFARGNNLGMRSATGRYVFLINSDVKILDGCLESLVAYLEVHPKVGMVAPRILNAYLRLQLNCRQFPGVRNALCEMIGLPNLFPRSTACSGTFMHWWAHDTELSVDVLSGCFWAVRCEALEQVGGLDESFFIYGEDGDWCKRFRQAYWGVSFYPGAHAIHYGGASSANAPVRFYVEMQKAKLQYWKKHHGRLGMAFCWLLIALHQTTRLVSRALLYMVPPTSRSENAFKLKRSLSCIRWVFRV